MFRLLAASAVVALTVSVAACDISGAIDPQISFATERQDWSATLVDTAQVDGNLRTLISTGLVLTPTECYNLRSSMSVRNGVISLTITGTQASSQCAAAPGAYGFTFLASGIDAGRYTVRVLYAIAGRPTATVLETTVTL